ncbi:MAG: hypothetical protein JST00_00275 [Deltaproteobacteria bacterium]|nr:hypothetical protein [Deltaproteobacteria bacterium]
MHFSRLLACLPVVAIVVATGCADGPLEGVRPVKYVKIDEANATTTRDPPPHEPSAPRRDAPVDEKPAATATTSAASSTTESVEPDELIANAGAAGKKPGKGGKPPKPIGGAPKTGGPPTDDKCYRVGRECCGEPLAEAPTKGKGGAKECPRGSVPGGACPKKRCKA